MPKVSLEENPAVAADEAAQEWYAAYTMSRHEKRVAEHCERIGIEPFLPLYRSQRSWKNRTTVDLQMPLFPNYIFVRLSPGDHGPLLRLPGVLSTVGNATGPIAIPEDEIKVLRRIAASETIEPYSDIAAGDRVRIRKGPLEGIAGVVLRKGNSIRFIVTIDLIGKGVALEIEGSALELIGPPSTSLTGAEIAVA